MSKLSPEKRLRRAPAARRAGDDMDPLKRLTRAELIRIIRKLETQTPINVRAGVEGNVASKHVPTILVNGPVRSGQTVTFEEGDLIIVGSVGSGAEIVAGGSIHVYGALRGRAYAGTSGQTGARIFCQRLEPELVAIEGISRMSEDLETSLRGRAAHAWRAGNNIELAALSELVDSQNHLESREAIGSLELSRPLSRNRRAAGALGQNCTARFSWARPLNWVWRLTSPKYGTTALKARAG